MTKELFIESITALKNQYDFDKKIAKNLSKAFPNAFEANLFPDNHYLSNALIKVLQIEMNDFHSESWIEYFCFELDFGIIERKIIDKKGNEVYLTNAGELYDFLNSLL